MQAVSKFIHSSYLKKISVLLLMMEGVEETVQQLTTWIVHGLTNTTITMLTNM